LRPAQLQQVPVRTLTKLKDDDLQLEYLEGDQKGKHVDLTYFCFICLV